MHVPAPPAHGPLNGVWTQPVLELHVSEVHSSPSSQSSAAPVHVPEVHSSFTVHASSSLHGVASGSFGFMQEEAPSQVSWVQGLPSVQSSPIVTVHVPAMQALALEHGFPSSHGVPSETLG